MERSLERCWRREMRSLLGSADPKQFMCLVKAMFWVSTYQEAAR